MVDVVVVRPAYDETTNLLHDWGGRLCATVQASGYHNVRDMPYLWATRAQVQKELKGSPECLVFYGHGERDHLIAQNNSVNSPIIDTSFASLSLLKNRIVYAVACHSAAVLGLSAVAAGTRTYIGYDDSFNVVTGGPEYWFEQATNVLLEYLLSSTTPTCADALAEAQAVYERAIFYYQNGPGHTHPLAFLAAAQLLWARDHLVLHGDPDAILR